MTPVAALALVAPSAGGSGLGLLGDPNVAYLLLVLGLLGVVAELYNPGALVPGALGLLALVLAGLAFSSLPVSWAGLLLVLAAIGVFVGELHTGSGVLAVVAVASLVAGSVLLYGPPDASAAHVVRVSPWIVAAVAVFASVFFFVVVRKTLRTRGLAVRTGIDALIGRKGVAASDLAPKGRVRVDGEVWSARAASGVVQAGEGVIVTGVSGVTLDVVGVALTGTPPASYREGGTSWSS